MRTVASCNGYVAGHAKQTSVARLTDKTCPHGLTAAAQSEDHGVGDEKH